MTDKEDPDKLPDERTNRSIPLNVETILVDRARKRKQFNPDDENEELKKDGSDVDTIRDDMETSEQVQSQKRGDA